MKLALYVRMRQKENELDDLLLEYEINGEMGRQSIRFNKFDEGESLRSELEKRKGYPVDLSGLSILEYHNPSSVILINTYEIDSKEDIKDTILLARDNLKETNPELFL